MFSWNSSYFSGTVWVTQSSLTHIMKKADLYFIKKHMPNRRNRISKPASTLPLIKIVFKGILLQTSG